MRHPTQRQVAVGLRLNIVWIRDNQGRKFVTQRASQAAFALNNMLFERGATDMCPAVDRDAHDLFFMLAQQNLAANNTACKRISQFIATLVACACLTQSMPLK